MRRPAILATTALLVGVLGAGQASGQLTILEDDVTTLQRAIIELDLVRAEDLVDDEDDPDEEMILSHALLRLYMGQCDEAVELVSIGDLPNTEEGAALGDIARGCARATAATITVRDEARGVEIRMQDDADRPLAPLLFDGAASARDAIERELGVDLPRPLRIELVRDQFTLSAMTGLPLRAAQTTGTVAVAKWGRVFLLSPRATPHGYPFLDTLSHEMVHLVVTRATTDKAPLWLQEGLAVRLQEAWRPPSPFDDRPPTDEVAAWGLKHEIGPAIDAIGPSVAMLPSAEEASVTYAKVTSFIGYWADEVGEGSLVKLLREVKARDGDDAVSEAMEEVSGVSFAEWADRWRADLLLAHDAPKDPFAHVAAEGLEQRMRLGELLALREHHAEALEQLEAAHAIAPRFAGARCGIVHVERLLGADSDASVRLGTPELIDRATGRWYSLRVATGVATDAEAERFAGVYLDPLRPEVACGEDGKPTHPTLIPLCEAAKAMPREPSVY